MVFTMDYIKTVFFIFLTLCCFVDGRGRRRSKRGNGKCNEYSFAEYNLTFFGDWSKQMFPRMYPRYRPKAQWSQLIGRTHGRTYHMWSEGLYASAALKKFVEERSAILFDREAQGYNDTRDHFTAAPIRGGVGRSSLRIFADGTHSKLSFVVKVVPSPDWFVGVDSLDLCKNGHWRRKIYAHLRPMDAGTDRGFTYTAPNWPSVPRERIFQITPTFPNHPASSFYNESLTRVPRMAHAIIEKVVEFRKKGSPRMPLDSGPNVVVYEQEHERQERLRLMARPTDAGTTSKKYNYASSDYLAKLNRLHGRPVLSRHTFLVRKLATSEAVPLKDARSPIITSTASRQLIIKHTLRDSPTNVAIHPTIFSSSIPEKPAPRSTIMTEEPMIASSMEVIDQEPTPEAVETKPEAMETNQEAVKTNPHSATFQDLMSGKSKQIATTYTNETEDNDVYDMTKTEVDPNKDLQTVYGSTANKPTHSDDMSPSGTAATLSSTAIDADQRAIYSEAYRTDYVKNFATQDNTDPVFGSLSDTLTKGYATDTDTKDSKTIYAEPTESLETDTQWYVGEASHTHDVKKVVPLRTVYRETVTETGYGTGREQEEHNQTKEADTVNKEPSYDGTETENHGNEDHMLDLDCLIGEWSDWSSCSKTCGFGVKTRSRSVTQYSQNAGLPCPRLDQEALCGSMRNCKWNYFSNIFNKDRKRRRRRRWHNRHG